MAQQRRPSFSCKLHDGFVFLKLLFGKNHKFVIEAAGWWITALKRIWSTTSYKKSAGWSWRHTMGHSIRVQNMPVCYVWKCECGIEWKVFRSPNEEMEIHTCTCKRMRELTRVVTRLFYLPDPKLTMNQDWNEVPKSRSRDV